MNDSPACSSSAAGPAASPAAEVDFVGRKVYRVGTLSYTKAGLFALFGWMLWGDFCFTLMETAAPAVLQVNLKDMGAANWLIGLVLVTIPGVLNMTVCPASSFWSDRFRSRWGRRIPFLFVATIPLSVFLVLIGFSRQIGAGLHGLLQAAGFSQMGVTLTVVVLLVFGFQLFNMVVSSVYYYLFNDVVPVAFLGRFLALFRIVGVLASAAFNWFMLKYAVSHMAEVYFIAAVLYCSAFLLMCWRIREGGYPPPPAHVDGGAGLLSGIKTFFKESYSHKFYWLFYLANTSWALVFAIGSFAILQAGSIGIDLEFYGKVIAVSGVVTAALMYPAGVLADRIHPLKVLVASSIAVLFVQILWLVFLFHDFSAPVARGIFVAIQVVGMPAFAIYMASEMPTYMRLLPKERYGQFCSANALVRSFGTMIGGMLLGLLLDLFAPFFADKDYVYRLIPVWAIVFCVAALFFLLRLHAAWKEHGGAEAYVPPDFAPTDPGEAAQTAARH